jgi:hypothetical protein
VPAAASGMNVILPPALGSDTIEYVSGSPLASVALALPSMIPSLNVSVGLTVIGPVGARGAAAPVSSRRTAPTCTQAIGESTGAAGAFPVNGLKIPSTALTSTARTLGVVVALGVAGTVATRALGVAGTVATRTLGVAGTVATRALGLTTLVGLADLDTVATAGDTAALELGVEEFAEGVWSADLLDAAEPVKPPVFVTAAEALDDVDETVLCAPDCATALRLSFDRCFSASELAPAPDEVDAPGSADVADFAVVESPDEFEEAGWAPATPAPAKAAAPTPRATASPPIRPIYMEARMAFSRFADQSP